MRKKIKACVSWLAAFLSGLMVLLAAGASSVYAVDLNAANSLQVTAVTSTSEYAEDVAGANVVFDLYKIADAVPVSNYDNYAYDFYEPYRDIEIGGIQVADINTGSVSLSNQQWNLLAQQATLRAINEGTKTIDGADVGETIWGLSSGLYLIIARGANIASYTMTETDDAGNENLVTIARSNQYIYSFAPAVISLPTKNAMTDAEGNIITDEDGIQVVATSAEYGDWVYNASASLKPDVSPLYGGVSITKNIDQFSGEEESTFVFRVTAQGVFPDDPNYTYSNVVAVAFNARTGLSSTARLDGIRAGASVTVEEVYTGRYRFGSLTNTTPEESLVITADRDVTFTAVNYLEGGHPGHGIQNHFYYEKRGNGGGWEYDQQTAASGLNR